MDVQLAILGLHAVRRRCGARGGRRRRLALGAQRGGQSRRASACRLIIARMPPIRRSSASGWRQSCLDGISCIDRPTLAWSRPDLRGPRPEFCVSYRGGGRTDRDACRAGSLEAHKRVLRDRTEVADLGGKTVRARHVAAHRRRCLGHRESSTIRQTSGTTSSSLETRDVPRSRGPGGGLPGPTAEAIAGIGQVGEVQWSNARPQGKGRADHGPGSSHPQIWPDRCLIWQTMDRAAID